METESEIAKWYRGRAVFITGATGFMGKVLVEKLLRSCPDIGTIFMLVRKKKDTSSQDRVREMLTSGLFDKHRDGRANLSDRLVVIPGDVAQQDLGISVEDRCLLEEKVSVVFHVAATVRFDEPLRPAVAINIEGTRAVLELCQGMRNLSALVHVSTAYFHCSGPVVQECIYSPPADPEKVKHCLAGLDDDLLKFITPRLIGEHPNTYTFTKAIAEHVVAGYSTKLPIVVVRPSIVSGSWKEPTPGWVDSYSGPTVLVVGASKGLLRSVYGRKEVVADLIPVDICINLLIAAAWDLGSREDMRPVPDVLVYNCVSRPFNPVTWGMFVGEIHKCVTRYATSDIFMRPGVMMIDSRARHMLTNLVNLALPAALVDGFVWITGGKPRFRRYLSKINKVADVFEFFTMQEWDFDVENVKRLKGRLSSIDREIFDFDVKRIIWEEYVTSYFLGIRRNVMDEEDDVSDATRKRTARRTLVAKIVRSGIIVILAVGVMGFFGVLYKRFL